MSYSLAFSQSIITIMFVADKVQQGFYDFVPTHELSDSLNIAQPSAVKILRNLNRAGLIETREGAKGGVRLAVPATEITVLDIFEAMEQNRPLFRPALKLNVTGAKPEKGQQVVADVLVAAEVAMKASLQGTTVAD
ncbi:MAG: Rrf2 family transcriptional regulator, partial [Anaerolineales bacterium]|nr:Rrf2 family transcriptional regulator [Anaerolineales bacterium]